MPSTATMSSSASANSQGASCSQRRMGTWKASSAATKAMAMDRPWRSTKCVCA